MPRGIGKRGYWVSMMCEPVVSDEKEKGDITFMTIRVIVGTHHMAALYQVLIPGATEDTIF
jgi:hypothetical protein